MSFIAREVIKGFALKFTEQTADDMLKALDRAGYAVVPKSPTMEMVMAGHEFCRRDPSHSMDSATRCYGAMLQSANDIHT